MGRKDINGGQGKAVKDGGGGEKGHPGRRDRRKYLPYPLKGGGHMWGSGTCFTSGRVSGRGDIGGEWQEGSQGWNY